MCGTSQKTYWHQENEYKITHLEMAMDKVVTKPPSEAEFWPKFASLTAAKSITPIAINLVIVSK